MVSKITQNGFNRPPEAWNVEILNLKAKNKQWITLNTVDSMFNGVLRDYKLYVNF